MRADVVGASAASTMAEQPATDADERVAALEQAFVTHWSHFGRWSQGTLGEEDGVLWFETPIRHLPYNMVIRTRIPDGLEAGAVVGRVAARFRARDVPYIWVVLPSDRPEELDQLIARQGLDLVETATGMDLELDAWVPDTRPTDGSFVEANYDPTALRDYVELMRTYWSVPESEQHLLETFNREYSGDRSPGVRLVAYLDGKPVGKLFLNTVELPDRVSIYGVAVKPETRGRGIATAMMVDALLRARAAGARRCVLHSSSMAISLYRRMGFIERCTFRAFATAPLWGTHHH